MTDRPILFSAPMVRALLDGSKTQTRRALNPQPIKPFWSPAYQQWRDAHFSPTTDMRIRFSVGDRLWVREAWRSDPYFDALPPRDIVAGAPILTEADTDPEAKRPNMLWGKLRPGMFMPRWASRLTLTVTEVRVQRLQDISEADAIAEGIEHVTTTSSGRFYRNFWNEGCPMMAYGAYRSLWDHINGDGAWATNPFVVAVTFTVERRNIDAAS